MGSNATLEQSVAELLSEAYETRVSNLSHSIQLTQKALALAKTCDDKMHARALSQLGLFFMIKGEFKQALEYSVLAITYFENENDLKGIADAKYNIGSVYYKTDSYHKGLEYLLECLRIYRQLEDHHNQSRVLKSMGTIYEYFGDIENATDSYIKCIQAAEKNNDLKQVSNAYNPLSGIYLNEDKIELAFDLIEKAIKIKKQTHDVRGLAFSLYGRGKCYLKSHDYERALKDFDESIAIQLEMGDKLGQGMVYTKLGLTYMALKDFDNAELHFNNALTVATETNVKFILFKTHYNLYLLELEKGDTKKALYHLQEYVRLRETVINSHSINIIKSYQSIKRIEALELEAKIQKERAEIIGKKNAELDSFFYRISHDLKGPIASLLGLNNMVQMEVKDDESLKYFGLYHSQILRINNIVMDLINLTRMNHDTEAKSKIDFKTLIEDCISSYSYLENFEKINFVTEIDETLNYQSKWAIVNTILQNLIENSIKYARNNIQSYVAIDITQEKEFVKIQVEDNGQGIRTTDQPKVFDMFFRANDHVQGTGLGLYILQRAVERLRGTVSFISELHVGTTFTVLLPLEFTK